MFACVLIKLTMLIIPVCPKRWPFYNLHVIIVKDAAESYHDLKGGTVYRGQKTWFKYVEKLIATSLALPGQLNRSVTLFFMYQSTRTALVLNFLHTFKFHEKYNSETNVPIQSMLCSANYQGIREDRIFDSCYKTKDLKNCNFKFYFILHADFRLNLTFLTLKMVTIYCRWMRIVIQQNTQSENEDLFCGTYTAFTIFSKSGNINMTYTYSVEGTYETVFVHSVISQGHIVSFPYAKIDQSYKGERKVFHLLKSSDLSVSTMHSYHIAVSHYFSLVLDTTGCLKGICWFTPTPFSQLLGPPNWRSRFVNIDSFQCLLLFFLNSSAWSVNDNRQRISYNVTMKKAAKNISLNKGENTTLAFVEHNAIPSVHVWNISFGGDKTKQSIEVLISQMSYIENPYFSPPECFHGGFASYETIVGELSHILTTCSDYQKYEGNRRFYGRDGGLLLVFYQYLINFECGNFFSKISATLNVNIQACHVIDLPLCMIRIYHHLSRGMYDNFHQNWLALRMSSSQSYSRLIVDQPVPPHAHMVISIHSEEPECAVLNFGSSLLVPIYPGIKRCYMNIMPKAMTSATGVRLSMLVEGTFLSSPPQLHFRAEPNVFLNRTKTLVPRNNGSLKILPQCGPDNFRFLNKTECRVPDIYEKIKAYAFVDAPFHSIDFTLTVDYLPMLDSWFTIKYFLWFPEQQSFEFVEAPAMVNSDNRQSVSEALQLPFPDSLKMWTAEQPLSHFYSTNDVLLLLVNKENNSIWFRIQLVLSLRKEDRLWRDRGAVVVYVAWNVSSRNLHGPKNSKLLLSLQGDIPQIYRLQSTKRKPSFEAFLIYNALKDTLNSSQWARETNKLGRYKGSYSFFTIKVHEKTFLFLENISYAIYGATLHSWTKANTECRNLNASLVVLRSSAEQLTLLSIVKLSYEFLFMPGIFLAIKGKADQVCNTAQRQVNCCARDSKHANKCFECNFVFSLVNRGLFGSVVTQLDSPNG